jgi:hypothetical protein
MNALRCAHLTLREGSVFWGSGRVIWKNGHFICKGDPRATETVRPFFDKRALLAGEMHRLSEVSWRLTIACPSGREYFYQTKALGLSHLKLSGDLGQLFH